MTFKKVEWFYIVMINGKGVGTVQKEGNQWRASSSADNWIYTGKSRREATENMLGGVR